MWISPPRRIDRKQFLLDRGVIALCWIEFTGVIGNRFAFLHDDGAKLIIGCIGVNVEWFGVIGKDQQCLLRDELLHLLEGLLVFFLPNECFGTSQSRQGCKYVGSTWPHVTIEVDCTQFGDVGRRFESQNGVDLLFPWFGPSGVNQKPSQSVSCTAHSHLSG